MSFIEQALKYEQDTIKNYRNLAEQCTSHKGIQYILQKLIKDHEKHLQSLGQMSGKEIANLENKEIYKEVARIFEKIKMDKNTFSCNMDQLRLYQEARELILQKQKLYEEMQHKTDNDEGKRLLQELINEEKKQAIVLDNIIEMVRRPQNWIENAEFYHLEDY